MRASLFTAALGLVLVTSCAKIFGVDDPGVEADGGAGQPCDTMSNNPTPCGPGLVCLASNSSGQGNVCAAQCTADSQCPAGQGCLAVPQNGMGGSSVVLACAPNTCGNSCGNGGQTQCVGGVCRNTCSTGGNSGPGVGSCPSDEVCVTSCGMCGQGVCSPTGDASGSSSGGGREGGTGYAPMPMPRGAVACATGTDNKVYVFGGFDTNRTPTIDVQIYDPASNSWSMGVNMLTARFAAGVANGQQNGTFVLTGGFVQGGMTTGDTELFNAFMTSAGTFTPLASMPMPVGAAAVTGMGQVFVAGGASSPNGTPLGTVQAFQLGNQWSNQSFPPMPTPRKFLAAANPQGNLLAIGGFDSTGAASKAVEIFNQGQNVWSGLASMPTARGKLAAAQGGGSTVYVVGGANGGALATLESYDTGSNTWTMLPPMPTPRAGLCAAWVNVNSVGGRLYAIGGDDGQMTAGAVYGNVEAYDPNGMTWSR